MVVSVKEAARALGVSPRRVNAMLHAGQLKGRKVGSNWVIEPDSLQRPARAGRPMSQRNAWAMILERSDWLSPQDAWKLRNRISRLKQRRDPERAVASWLSSRGERLEFSAPAPAVLLDDARAIPGGVSDPRSMMSSYDLVEVYVHQDDLDKFRADHMMVPSRGRANVVVHSVPMLPPRPIPPILLAADLMDHGSDRDVRQAHEILAGEFL